MSDDPQSGTTATEASGETPPTEASPPGAERNERGQWKPGVSGSPGGARKWRRELQKEITEQWADKVPMLMNAFYAYTLRALKNNEPYGVSAFKEVMDRIAGKVPQRIIEETLPANAAGDLWSALTEEQLDQVIAADGVLPDDVAERAMAPAEAASG